MWDITESCDELRDRVRSGLIFRGGIRVSGYKRFACELLVIDLRTRFEINSFSTDYSDSIYSCSLSEGANNGTYTDWANRVNKEYIDKEVIQSYKKMFLNNLQVLKSMYEVIANSPRSVFIHCSAGKDRTGVVIACLLRMIGISKQSIACDYSLAVERVRSNIYTTYEQEFFKQGLLFEDYKRLVFPFPSVIDGFINEIEKECETFQNLLWHDEKHRFSTISKLKKKILRAV